VAGSEMCGMKKWDFPQVLSKFNISYFQYSAEDVKREANAIN
jgi:hypothetical protein